MRSLRILISEEDWSTLEAVAHQRGSTVDVLCENAVSEACLSERVRNDGGQGMLSFAVASFGAGPVSAVDAGIASPDRPRCDGGQVGGLGECLVCDAEQGEACRMPLSDL